VVRMQTNHEREAVGSTRNSFPGGRQGLGCVNGGRPVNRRRLCAFLLAILLLVGVVAWYLFRPEKAFIDDVVDEPFPAQVPPDAAR
jgi:hypothetical protein